MDKIITDLATTVSQVVESYAVEGFNARLFYAENPAISLYTVIAIPDVRPDESHPVILARIDNNTAIIEVDNTDRYLYRLLVQAGVPREQIIRAYLGETVPLSQIPVD